MTLRRVEKVRYVVEIDGDFTSYVLILLAFLMFSALVLVPLGTTFFGLMNLSLAARSMAFGQLLWMMCCELAQISLTRAVCLIAHQLGWSNAVWAANNETLEVTSTSHTTQCWSKLQSFLQWFVDLLGPAMCHLFEAWLCEVIPTLEMLNHESFARSVLLDPFRRPPLMSSLRPSSQKKLRKPPRNFHRNRRPMPWSCSERNCLVTSHRAGEKCNWWRQI